MDHLLSMELIYRKSNFCWFSYLKLKISLCKLTTKYINILLSFERFILSIIVYLTIIVL